ncbi:MAG TPA: glycosyltransferase family 2 protein [Pseudomonadales bacterium]|nr:glycosyltransferase family 2 protein [Pseudomonadales bacterium]
MLSIVVPTYKEAGNLPGLAESIHRCLDPAGIEYELLFVDDNSPDDTVDVCATLARDYPVRLLQPQGRERDLSLSVVDGIKSAKYGNILVMDADLSHPPEAIADMLGELESNPDAFVMGSRYVNGGSFDRDWSLWRFINSHVATLLARPLVRCSDPMSGFFMFRREFLGDVAALRPMGYKIGLEIMVRGNFSRVLEVPIAFKDREIGLSKMNLDQQVKYLRHLRRLYLYRFGGFAEFVHFGLVGASGFIVDITFFYLLQFFGLDHYVARAISFWPAASWNWAMNRRGTFGDRRRRPRARQWVEFIAASAIGFVINYGLYYSLTTYVQLFERYHILAFISGIAVGSLFNFAASTLFVYSEKRR